MSRDRRLSSTAHFEAEDVVAEYATFEFLLPPERSILDELGAEVSEARMLDIGVGGGRTTTHLAHRVARYVGIDVSAGMIAACRQRFEDRLDDRLRFLVADARDLSAFEPGSFDLVLFSWQGIDSIDLEGRDTALREIRRVCASGARFAFSSDNILWARDQRSFVRSIRHASSIRRRGPDRGLRAAAEDVSRTIANTRRVRAINPSASLRGRRGTFVYRRPRFELSPEGFADPREMIEIDGSVIAPSAQVVELAACGFRSVRIFDPDGSDVTGHSDDSLRRWEWLYYLATAEDADIP